MALDIPIFKNKKKLIAFLIANKATLIAQKMNSVKHADAFSSVDVISDYGIVSKTAAGDIKALLEKDEFTVIAVINTTNIMDSHKDVHLKGIWSKSLKENKRIMHIQEHESQKFSSIISDGRDLKAFTKTMTWKELGYNYEGETQALIFESKVKKSRNSYMHEQYAKGHVNNHSVGMRYVKIDMAINDEDYEKEFAVWEKYIDKIVNKEDAKKSGYFWAVHEAKAVEGSAVPIGSNHVTPTLSIKEEPLEDTQKQEQEAADALQAKKNYFINKLRT